MRQSVDTRPYTSSNFWGYGRIDVEDADITPEVKDDSVIFCHGWRSNWGSSVEESFRAVKDALETQGYNKNFVSWRWLSELSWGNSIESAKVEGERIAKYVERFYKERNKRIHIIGHSLGAKVAMEAQRNLSKKGQSFDSVHLTAGAVKASDFSGGSLYSSCLENTELFNYRDPNDLTLGILFPINGAIGKQGIELEHSNVHDTVVNIDNRMKIGRVHRSHLDPASESLKMIGTYLSQKK